MSERFGPGKSAGYHGPIQVDMEFVWTPGRPTSEDIVVTEIEVRDGELWICSANKLLGRAWNDEARFRKFAQPVTRESVMTDAEKRHQREMRDAFERGANWRTERGLAAVSAEEVRVAAAKQYPIKVTRQREVYDKMMKYHYRVERGVLERRYDPSAIWEKVPEADIFKQIAGLFDNPVEEAFE